MSISEEYDFCVVITTYNRPLMLNELIEQINQMRKEYRIKIIIFDDGSDQEYNLPNYVTKIKFFPNMGKKKYWKIINSSFKYIKNLKSKYFIYLPDDIKLVDDFFNVTKNIYESINDNNKICLSILTDGRVNRTNWTNFKTIDYGSYLKTQWNDLCFISEKKFFEELNFMIEEIPTKRWLNNPNLSSGVGNQISVKLYNKGKNMYHTKNSLVFHSTHESKMNFDERKINKIITN